MRMQVEEKQLFIVIAGHKEGNFHTFEREE